jgi:hypothetical protein
VKEIASGLNDNRPKLLTLLKETSITRRVVEHKDRLTRFGAHYIETLMETQGRAIEVVNVAENDKEDLITDLASVIYSFCARLYGQRRAKRKTETIVKELHAKEGEEVCDELSSMSSAQMTHAIRSVTRRLLPLTISTMLLTLSYVNHSSSHLHRLWGSLPSYQDA